jgi:hypothetical protein
MDTSIQTRSFDDSSAVLVPVHFEYIDVGAESVCVAGTFNAWHPGATPLTRYKSRGVWMKDLQLSPGRYEYSFVVDGHWKRDPACQDIAENPFGGLNSVLHVKDPPVPPKTISGRRQPIVGGKFWLRKLLRRPTSTKQLCRKRRNTNLQPDVL